MNHVLSSETFCGGLEFGILWEQKHLFRDCKENIWKIHDIF